MGLEGLLARLEGRSETSRTCEQMADVPAETAPQSSLDACHVWNGRKIKGESEPILAALAHPLCRRIPRVRGPPVRRGPGGSARPY
jgi:hypothetical protein